MFELEPLKQQAEEIVKEVSQLLGADFPPELTSKLFEAAMGPVQMRLYCVANFYAEECERCRGAGAFFSACLMISSATEALLALLCLQSQEEVEKSEGFKDFPKAETYEGRVLKANFEHYIKLASFLDWVPSNAVDAEMLEASVTDFPLVAGALYPKLSPAEQAEKVLIFMRDPGIEMLRILQNMRNLIHAPRWPRMGITMSPTEFEANSKFTFVIGFQVMMCLFAFFSRKSAHVTTQISSSFDDLEQFSISYRASNGSVNHAAASFGVMVGSICATA